MLFQENILNGLREKMNKKKMSSLSHESFHVVRKGRSSQ